MSKISINIVQGTLRKDKYFFGIDLGTTNSLISATDIEKNESQIIQFVNDNALIPSVIYFHKGGKISVGHEAKSLMKEDPENGISSVKRLIGLTKNEIETLFPNLICEENEKGECRVGKTTNHLYTPIELSSFILKEIKEKTEEKIKNKVEKIVITVPAYFNDLQRQATHKAANLAGLQVLRMINEPTAASLAYGIGKNSEIEKIIAVYDLGGGTFDISILRVVDGVFDVLSTHGNTALGGDDFDNAIVQFWKEKYPLSEFTYKPETLINKAEQAKKELNEKEESIQDFLGLDLKISKIEFEKIAQKLISETLFSCTKALTDAGLQKNEIDEIILVGGSTRMYLIKEKLKEFFGKTLNDSLNPDEAVALGAGIQAGILAGNNQELLLLDVTPLSLGIETMGGLMDVVIPRNSKIPCSFSKNYTTQKDGQTKIEISIYQGERELVENNISLGKFILEGIPSMPASLPKIEVNFYIDTNGLLQVKAKELRSGAIQSIEVKPKDFIDDTVVEKFLKESIEFAEDDINNRKVLDAKNEAVLLLDATAKFMRIHAANMQDTDIQLMNEASLELKNELESKDLEKIKAAIENLNRVGRPYAEDLMDHTISDALKGKQV